MTEPVDHTPAQGRSAFDCPHCQAYSQQLWSDLWHQLSPGPGMSAVLGGGVSRCARCQEDCLWLHDQLIYPLSKLGPRPHADMPSSVHAIYEEARTVSSVSRKSAAALLRLALQLLVDDLEPGKADINGKIGALVKRGLDPQVQQAMDVLRVVGNNAVHPGQIDLDADDELLPALFAMLNLVVEQVVARPKHVAGLFASLPATAQAAVAKRDATP